MEPGHPLFYFFLMLPNKEEKKRVSLWFDNLCSFPFLDNIIYVDFLMERSFALSFIVYSVKIELVLANLNDKISFLMTVSNYSFSMSFVFVWCN